MIERLYGDVGAFELLAGHTKERGRLCGGVFIDAWADQRSFCLN